MEWIDEGIVVGLRRHGETSAIATLLTREHGRHAGLVRGGAGRRSRAMFEPGNRLRVTWRARLFEHLGSYACEPMQATTALLLDDPLRLAAVASAAAVVDAALPEREPHQRVHDGFCALLDQIGGTDAGRWGASYVRWELDLLADLGFGLDLGSCAVTGSVEDLAFVSPKSGRAVSRGAGARYADRLLPLPAFLRAAGPVTADGREILDGLRLTGFFLDRDAFSARQERSGRALPGPAARERLLSRLGRLAA